MVKGFETVVGRSDKADSFFDTLEELPVFGGRYTNTSVKKSLT